MQTVSILSQSGLTFYPLRLTTIVKAVLLSVIFYAVIFSLAHLSKLVAETYSVQHFIVGRTHLNINPIQTQNDRGKTERVGRVLIPKSVLQTSTY